MFETNRNSKPSENSTNEFLTENWESIIRRSASHTARRALAAQRWEERLAFINRAAIGVGVLLIVQFPIACYAFAQIERSALELCAAL